MTTDHKTEETNNNIITNSLLSYVLISFAIASGYWLLGKLVFLIAIPPGYITSVWLPAGFSLACIITFKNKALLGIFLGGFWIAIDGFLSMPTPPLLLNAFGAAFIVGISSTLQPLAGFLLLKRFASAKNVIKDSSRFVRFTIIIPIMCLVSCTIGSMGLIAFNLPGDISEIWLIWWLGDSLGVMLVTPFIIAWYGKLDYWIKPIKLLQRIIVIGSLAAVSILSFYSNSSNDNSAYSLAFLVIPFLVLIALKYSVRIVTISIMLVSFIAALATADGGGPFSMATTHQSILMLQLFLFVTSFSTLVIFCLANQQRENIDLLDKSASELKHAYLKLTRRYQESSEELVLGQSRFSSIFNQAPIGIALINSLTGDFKEVNQKYLEIIGYKYADIASIDWMAITHKNDVQEDLDNMAQLNDKKISMFNMDKRYIKPNGDIVWVNMTVSPLKHKENDTPYHLCMIHDISISKKAEQQLELAASVFTHVKEAIKITDPKGIILDVNDTFCHVSGYTKADVVGINRTNIRSDRHPPEFYDHMVESLRDAGFWQGEIWSKRKNGEVYPENLTVSAVKDAQGVLQNYVSISTDITDLKKHQNQLERMAHFDTLTHLPNRSLLSDRLRQAMNVCKRDKNKIAVVFLDIDGFKQVNDSYGHHIGDQLLIKIANVIQQTLRENDTLSRFGGDEFVILLTNLEDYETCKLVLNRILKAASQPLKVNNKTHQVSASIGATFYPDDNADADQLIRHADHAMYVAKQNGKNCYHIFDADQDSAINEQQEKLSEIKLALDNNEFVLFYQPKVNMKTGEIIGAEALIRWLHPEQGLLPPNEFLPVIENQLVSLEIGEWVIDTALKQVETWQSNGLRLPVSVNIDGYQLEQENFSQRLKTLLDAHPSVKPELLELEVLETNALGDIINVSETMNQCKQLGVSFALDDFGTGYSSLTYLRRLPAHFIKVDQSFVRDMLVDPEDLSIVESVINLAISFNRAVIAEGVETEEHGIELLKLGCEIAQGYGIARPMPADDFAKWQISWRQPETWKAA